jgi:hypothetical protein
MNIGEPLKIVEVVPLDVPIPGEMPEIDNLPVDEPVEVPA